MTDEKRAHLQKTANQVRKGALTAVYSAQSGHPGGSLSVADILTYLYEEEMRLDPNNANWEDRDRLVLSKGHTSPALYAMLALKGYIPQEELKTFRKTGSRLQGHPDMKKCPGVDFTTGSLGQGASAAVGMALMGRLGQKDYRVYTILGDGEIQEGQIWESAMFAAHQKLDNLCYIVDNNDLQIDGSVSEVCSPYPIDEKFAAFGFEVINIDGHNFDEIEAAIQKAKSTKGRPTCIVAKTIKGKNVSFMEGLASWHGSAPNAQQYEDAMAQLDKLEEVL